MSDNTEEFEDYELPEPVEMTGEELAEVVRREFGEDIKFTEQYWEADYTALLKDVDGNEYVVLKLGKDGPQAHRR